MKYKLRIAAKSVNEILDIYRNDKNYFVVFVKNALQYLQSIICGNHRPRVTNNSEL